MKNAKAFADKLIETLKRLDIKVVQKDDSLNINGIEIVKDLVPIKTLAGEQLREGFIASSAVTIPSSRWDEPDGVDELTIYEGRNMEAAVRASIDAAIKNFIDGFLENYYEQELELEEFNRERVESI